jgi:hypothetical protein
MTTLLSATELADIFHKFGPFRVTVDAENCFAVKELLDALVEALPAKVPLPPSTRRASVLQRMYLFQFIIYFIILYKIL